MRTEHPTAGKVLVVYLCDGIEAEWTEEDLENYGEFRQCEDCDNVIVLDQRGVWDGGGMAGADAIDQEKRNAK